MYFDTKTIKNNYLLRDNIGITIIKINQLFEHEYQKRSKHI